MTHRERALKFLQVWRMEVSPPAHVVESLAALLATVDAEAYVRALNELEGVVFDEAKEAT